MTEKRNIHISEPSIGEEEWLAIKPSIMSGWVTQGPKVAEFEKLFAGAHNVKHAFAVTSCTTGLHLALVAAGIGPGDEVIVPAFTWVATANAVLYVGATPVFVDIEIETFNIDPKEVSKKRTDKTKAIIPVHLFGLCANMDAIKQASEGLFIIEDGACAAGAKYKNVYAGGLGDIGVFSFHPRKSITTGEGGMITTNNDDLADKINKLRNHGAEISEEQRHHGPKPYILPDFNMLGYNYRMTDLQGAVGVVQMSKLFPLIAERNEWATYYTSQFSKLNWINTPYTNTDYTPGWQSYAVSIDESKSPISRNDLMEYLQSKGISTRPGTHAVHMLNYYKEKYNISENDFPMAKLANNTSIAIPLHNKMTKEDYEYVVHCILNI